MRLGARSHGDRRNMANIRVIAVSAALISGCVLSCKKEYPPEPLPAKNGKRDYIWSIVSIDYAGRATRLELQSLWGNSASDVWGAAGDAPDVRDCLWHYDGVKWSRATEGTPITELTGNKVVYAVWGTARDNVWAFGRKISQGVLGAFMMHYDGTRWADATPNDIANTSSTLYTVDGISSNDIWVGGYEYALHYDGIQWTTHLVADSMIVGSITGSESHIYLCAYSPWGRNTLVIYRLIGTSFTVVDSTTDNTRKFGPWLLDRDGRMLSFTNGVISTQILQDGGLNSSGWTREFTTATYFGIPYAQSDDCIFATGQRALLYHWNGVDWQQVSIEVPGHYVDPLAWFWGVWADGNQVFVCDVENGMVYHGK